MGAFVRGKKRAAHQQPRTPEPGVPCCPEKPRNNRSPASRAEVGSTRYRTASLTFRMSSGSHQAHGCGVGAFVRGKKRAAHQQPRTPEPGVPCCPEKPRNNRSPASRAEVGSTRYRTASLTFRMSSGPIKRTVVGWGLLFAARNVPLTSNLERQNQASPVVPKNPGTTGHPLRGGGWFHALPYGITNISYVVRSHQAHGGCAGAFVRGKKRAAHQQPRTPEPGVPVVPKNPEQQVTRFAGGGWFRALTYNITSYPTRAVPSSARWVVPGLLFAARNVPLTSNLERQNQASPVVPKNPGTTGHPLRGRRLVPRFNVQHHHRIQTRAVPSSARSGR